MVPEVSGTHWGVGNTFPVCKEEYCISKAGVISYLGKLMNFIVKIS